MFSRRISARYNRGRAGSFGGAAFNGNFAQLITSIGLGGNLLGLSQCDLGITYGATPAATGTVPPAGTFTGALSGNPVPITFRVNTAGVVGAGATFDASFDGGATQGMVNFAPAAGTPFALTGAGTGLSIAFAAGTTTAGDLWKATCSAWADQSASALHYTQGTAALQFLVSVGINGKASLLPIATTQFMASTLNLPAPGTTPTFIYGLLRQLSWAASTILVSANAATEAHMIFATGVTPSLSQFNASTVNGNSGATLNNVARIQSYYANSAGVDYLKCGAAAPTQVSSAGNNASTGRRIGKDGAGAVAAAADHFLWIYLNTLPSAGQLASLDAASLSWLGPTVLV